jgi:hypothetical protein
VNANTELDMEALQDAMVATIQAAFPALQTVEFDREETNRAELPVPACLLEWGDLDGFADPDPGTEQQAMTARFEARFVVGFRTPQAKLETRKLALAFAAFLRRQSRWPGAVTGPAMVMGCHRDDFHAELDQFEVWRVEWSHVVHLGASVWTGEGVTPTRIYLGSAPDVGVGNEASYVQVAGPTNGG